MLYDGMVVLGLWMATLLPVAAVAGDVVPAPVVRAIAFLELYAFFVGFWILRGQTIGMVAWRLALETDHGPRLSLNQATLRFLGGCLSIACVGLGYLWVLVDPARRSWSDLLSSSRVVVVPRA